MWMRNPITAASVAVPMTLRHRAQEWLWSVGRGVLACGGDLPVVQGTPQTEKIVLSIDRSAPDETPETLASQDRTLLNHHARRAEAAMTCLSSPYLCGPAAPAARMYCVLPCTGRHITMIALDAVGDIDL